MQRKRCTTCSRELPLTDFHRHPTHFDGRAQICKDCMRSYKWATRMNRRAEVHLIFGGKCCRCGNGDWRVLELDHVAGGGTADRQHGRIDKTYSRAMIEHARSHRAEFQLLCANCHRIKTWEDREKARAPFPGGQPISNEARMEMSRQHARDGANRRWAATTREERRAHALKGGATRAAAQTHCKRGHEFTPENTYIDKRGSRICRTCKRETAREIRAKRKAAKS